MEMSFPPVVCNALQKETPFEFTHVLLFGLSSLKQFLFVDRSSERGDYIKEKGDGNDHRRREI